MKDLVGQGKPLYSSLDKAAGLLKRKVGTGSEFLKELMAIPGVKQTEVAERGLGELLNAPKMTHEQFLSALQSKPVPAIKEKVLGEPVKDSKARNKAWEQAYEDAIDQYLDTGHTYSQATLYAPEVADRNINRYLPEELQEHVSHHGEWTIPGGENYREMLIKAPKGAEQFPGNPLHFGGEPGILASMRLKDRTGPNGEKLLHLEELQSDWHQKGREGGYKMPGEANAREVLKDYIKSLKKRVYDHVLNTGLNQNQAELISAKTPLSEMAYMLGETEKLEDLGNKALIQEKQAPDAPFKKNWEEMALKRLVHHAAENGYHGIVVTPGQEQADRYDLSKHIDELHYNPKTHRLIAAKKGRRLIDEQSVPPEKLESHIGKEAALKVMAQEPNVNGLRSLTGEEIKIGGEGMKGFYDKKVPNILNSIGKKYGVKTQLHGVELQSRGKERTPEEYEQAVQDAGFTMSNLPMDRAPEFDYHPKKVPAHYFPITDQMRQDVLKNGLPLYKQGGNVHASLDNMRYELSNRKG
jgi:hypothetical protein